MEQSASAAEAAKPGSSPGLQQQAQKLVAVAACVRAAYLLMVAVFALLFADYDTSTSILSESCADNWPDQAASAQRYLPAVVWDSIFLNRIAACGYEYEQFFAFYPGVPGELVRLCLHKSTQLVLLCSAQPARLVLQAYPLGSVVSLPLLLQQPKPKWAFCPCALQD